MPYPTLLLPLDDDARADLRLDHAIRVAQAFSSRLVGLSCRRPAPNVDIGMGGRLGLDALTEELARAQQQARQQEAAFAARCDRAGLAAFECLVDDADDPLAGLVRHARCSDLLILGQPDPDEAGHARRRARLDDIVLHSARPALVLPYAGRFETVGERVLVAWDDSQQAARALSDALPLLARARSVRVVTFDRTLGESGTVDQARLGPLTKWFAGHGITVDPRVEFTRSDIGNALLSHAAETGADLLVMGAWGQSRLAERLLGGCTRTVFDSMTLPVLTSH